MKLSEDSPGNWGITEPGSDDTLTRLTLALDVMGGDFGPSVTVPAALQALNSNSQLTLLLVGDPDAITPLLAKADFEQRSRLQIIPAQSVIASDARPAQAQCGACRHGRPHHPRKKRPHLLRSHERAHHARGTD